MNRTITRIGTALRKTATLTGVAFLGFGLAHVPTVPGADAANAATPIVVERTAATQNWHPKALKPCKTEDSSNCYWDAANRGNGKGLTFWADRSGKVHYTYVKCVKASNAMAATKALRDRDGEYAMRICSVNIRTKADGAAASKFRNVERYGA